MDMGMENLAASSCQDPLPSQKPHHNSHVTLSPILYWHSSSKQFRLLIKLIPIRILFQSLIFPMVLKTVWFHEIANCNTFSCFTGKTLQYLFFLWWTRWFIVTREFQVKFSFKRTVAIARPKFLNSDWKMHSSTAFFLLLLLLYLCNKQLVNCSKQWAPSSLHQVISVENQCKWGVCN